MSLLSHMAIILVGKPLQNNKLEMHYFLDKQEKVCYNSSIKYKNIEK